MMFFISIILYPSVQGEKFTDELSISVLKLGQKQDPQISELCDLVQLVVVKELNLIF